MRSGVYPFSLLAGRRWSEGPDEGLCLQAPNLSTRGFYTLPLTLALSPQAGRGDECAACDYTGRSSLRE
jgi:hypothetical protein